MQTYNETKAIESHKIFNQMLAEELTKAAVWMRKTKVGTPTPLEMKRGWVRASLKKNRNAFVTTVRELKKVNEEIIHLKSKAGKATAYFRNVLLATLSSLIETRREVLKRVVALKRTFKVLKSVIGDDYALAEMPDQFLQGCAA